VSTATMKDSALVACSAVDNLGAGQLNAEVTSAMGIRKCFLCCCLPLLQHRKISDTLYPTTYHYGE